MFPRFVALRLLVSVACPSFGAEPKVGVRFYHADLYIFPPGALYETDGGNYRVKQETAVAEGTDFDELTGHSVQTSLDDLTDN